MKNVHILSTDQPSRLYLEYGNGDLCLSNNLLPQTSRSNNQHIYITSDGEIKQGDWTLMFDDFGNLFLCDKPQQYLGIEKGHHLNKGLRKIILTTDPTLIADGVQSIDDEFLEWFVNLEWFVKNPTCEFVKVNYELGNCLNCEWNHDMCPNAEECLKNKYMIIIPQEEPKHTLENKPTIERKYTVDEVLDFIDRFDGNLRQAKEYFNKK